MGMLALSSHIRCASSVAPDNSSCTPGATPSLLAQQFDPGYNLSAIGAKPKRDQLYEHVCVSPAEYNTRSVSIFKHVARILKGVALAVCTSSYITKRQEGSAMHDFANPAESRCYLDHVQIFLGIFR